MSRRFAQCAIAALLAVGLAIAGFAAAAPADEAAVTVRGGEHAGFGRLVFDFATATPYTAEIVDGVLLVTIPAATHFDLSPLRRDLESYIDQSRMAEDGKSVRLPLKAGFTLKHYTLGPKLVIDLIDPAAGLEAALSPAAGASEPAPQAAGETPQSETAAQHQSQAQPADEAQAKSTTPAETGMPAAAPQALPDSPADPVQPTGQPGPKVLVRVGEHPGFSRMVFDWPFSVPYRIEEGPGTATLWFGRPAQLDLSRYRLDPPARVGALVPRVVAEGLAVDLAIPKGAKLTHYTDGPLVVIDVVGGELPLSQATAPAAQTAQDSPASQPPAAAAESAKQTETAEPAQAAQQVQSGDGQPAAKSGAAPTELLPEAMKGQAAAEAAPAKAAPAPAAKSPEATAPETAAPEAKTPANAADAHDAAPSEAAAPAAQEGASAEVNLISANGAPDEASEASTSEQPAKPRRSIALRFNWAEPVGAAAFVYSGRLWLVFDRLVQSDIAEKITKAAPALTPVEQLAHPAATILRMRLPVGFTPQLRTENDDWIVDLRKHDNEIATALEAVIDYSGQEALLRVALRTPGQVISATDPDLGATLWIVPSQAPGVAMARQFSLPELRLLPTFQGLAVEPLTDTVTVALDERGAVIAGDGGFNVSAETIRGTQSSAPVAFDTSHRLFDLAAWRGGGAFLTRKQELQLNAASAEQGDADLARLELARFYFAHGLARETLGALELIERDSPTMAEDPQLLLLKGASLFLSNEFEAASEILLHPALDGEWDAHLWRGALAAAGEDWPSAGQFLLDSEPLIEPYAPPVRNRLWLLGAEAQLQLANGGTAQQYLDQVRKGEPSVFDQARVDYLEGKRLALEGEGELAAALWQAVAQGGYGASSARARLALIDRGLESGELSRADATVELEHLQFAWRGDAFEFSLLQRLGELYLEQDRYRDALLALRQAASYLPHATRGKAIAQRMREVFADLFLTDLGKGVAPVAALAIYREFRELTPGGEVGDALVARLAERLVEVDLLQQAAELLQGQIDLRLTGPDRAATGNRVAMLQLLDKRPEQALAALDQTDMADLPEALAEERHFLRARALIEAGKSGEALALLGDDKGAEAQRLRAQLYWTERRWPEAGQALEGLLPEQLSDAPGDPEDWARVIASLAVAYTLAGDSNGLADLDWRYGNFMAGTGQAEAFAMLTGDLNGGAITSIADELAGVGTIQAFMVDYRERLTTPDLPTLN